MLFRRLFSEVFSDAIVNWPWTESRYPWLAHASDEEHDLFAIKHVLLHMLKAVGQLAAFPEARDHGKKLPRRVQSKMKVLAAKIVINGFQLAKLSGLDADGLEREIRAVIAAGLPKDR